MSFFSKCQLETVPIYFDKIDTLCTCAFSVQVSMAIFTVSSLNLYCAVSRFEAAKKGSEIIFDKRLYF